MKQNQVKIGKQLDTQILDGKKILITGGTGSFGHAFISYALSKSDVKQIVVVSRDEMKQWEMGLHFQNDSRLVFKIADVRDYHRIEDVMKGVDYVIHAAAQKIVPTAEFNPEECIKTNILGAMNIVRAARATGVERVVALSTDKASSPINLYGATKLASDKLFVAANLDSAYEHTKFMVVRYGNVMGSRGSVIPFFLKMRSQESLPITDVGMTRFMITLQQGVDLVLVALSDGSGGELYVKKIPSMRVVDIAKAINPDAKLDIIGIRPGEKLHEQMISENDSFHTYEYDDHFKILPSLNNWANDPSRIADGKLVDPGFTYTSENNAEWMKIEELRSWISQNETYLYAQ